MTKKEKKEWGGVLAEIFTNGGSELVIEHTHGFSDCIPLEVAKEINGNTEVGEEIEHYMNIELAKKFARFAGGKFIPKGGK